MSQRLNYYSQSETEKAVLEWTEAVTKLTEQGVTDEVYDRVRAELSETQISEVTFAIGVINTWNRLNVACRTVPGVLRPNSRV